MLLAALRMINTEVFFKIVHFKDEAKTNIILDICSFCVLCSKNK